MIVTASDYRRRHGYLGQTPEEMAAPEGPRTDWGAAIIDLARGYAEYDLASSCLDLNLSRANQGLPPVDCGEYGTGVQIGMADTTRNTILIVVGVLAAVYLLPKLLK